MDKLKVTAVGHVTTDGKLVLEWREGFLAKAKVFAGQQVSLTLQRYEEPASRGQKGYYWRVVIPFICQALLDAGYANIDHAVTHDILKKLHNLQSIPNENGGEPIRIPASTEALSKDAFARYLHRVTEWCREYFGMELPPPDPTKKAPKNLG